MIETRGQSILTVLSASWSASAALGPPCFILRHSIAIGSVTRRIIAKEVRGGLTMRHLGLTISSAVKSAGFALVSLTLANCSGPSGGDTKIAPELQNLAPLQKSSVDVNKYPANKMVCDPFGNPPDPRSNVGLKGSLYYILPNQLGSTNLNNLKVNDYFNLGYKSNQTVFLSQLNVPTRIFDQGFATESGAPVKDDNGDILVEWFAMKFKTVLRLGPTEEEGMYQVAALSDDGTIVQMQQPNGTWKTIIDNDGLHPTRFGCGVEPVQFTRETEYMSDISYYQGPRMHISFVMMKRKMPANGAQDPLCGTLGNDTFFDSNNGSTPKQAYKDLLARGWQPMSRDNFALPVEAMWNPCLEAEKPQIQNLRVTYNFAGTVTIEWNTNMPATSQLLYTREGSDTTQITESDNLLRTAHSVTLSQLDQGVVYAFQGVSTAGTLGRVVSAPLNVTIAPD